MRVHLGLLYGSLAFLLIATFVISVSNSSRGAFIHKEEVTSFLLLGIFDGGVLVDTRAEVVRISSEGDIHHVKELVHTSDHALGSASVGVLCGLTTEDDDLIGEISRHDEIVLHDKGSSLGIDDPTFHDASSEDTLFRIQVRGWLIDKIEVARLCQGNDQGDTLKLTTRQVLDFVIKERVDIEGDKDFRAEER